MCATIRGITGTVTHASQSVITMTFVFDCYNNLIGGCRVKSRVQPIIIIQVNFDLTLTKNNYCKYISQNCF